MLTPRPVPLLPVRPPYPPVRHRQYSRAMTIAIGLLATDGIVVAADTSLSTPHFKIGHGKVACGISAIANEPDRTPSTIAVTGAGIPFGYIEHLQREIIDGRWAREANLKEYTERIIKDFYTDHVVPFAAYGNDRPGVAMIVASYPRTLLTTDYNAVTQCHDCAVVGAGEMYARALLNKLYFPVMDARSMVVLALYVIYMVKEIIEECGKDTTVWCLQADGLMTIPHANSAKVEALFAQHSTVEARILHHLFSNRLDSPDDSWQTVMDDIEGIRKECLNLVELKSASPLNRRRSKAGPSPPPPLPELP